MDTQKVQVVSSYVRYKKEKPETKKDNTILALVMSASIIVLIAVIFWQVTLGLTTAGLLTYKLHRTHKHREYLKAHGIVVNHINGKREYV